jgi:uncharacterized protein (TIGR03083 family)
MAGVDVWPVVHGERTALAADLAPLSEDQWSTTSLCAQWTVRDVVAHMAGTAQITPASFFPKLIGSGFSFDRLQAKGIAANLGTSDADTLSHFESIITSEKRPPGPKDTILAETIIHSEDIRRALGIAHQYPTDAVVELADFFKGSNLIIGTKNRISGLRLTATDTEWAHGNGPEVSGPMLSLLMAMTGRKAVLGDLTGDGVGTLRERA